MAFRPRGLCNPFSSLDGSWNQPVANQAPTAAASVAGWSSPSFDRGTGHPGTGQQTKDGNHDDDVREADEWADCHLPLQTGLNAQN